ncbi:MAG TPA: 50S ribosomal protein L5, partial [Burkholderiaceae bacterium]
MTKEKDQKTEHKGEPKKGAETKKAAKPGAEPNAAAKAGADKKGGESKAGKAGAEQKGGHLTAGGTVPARLQAHYREQVVPALQKQFSYPTSMQVPRFVKITLNMGVGEAVADKKNIDAAVADLTRIA